MRNYLKSGASVVALLAAVSFAHAQMNEHQGAGHQAGTERQSPARSTQTEQGRTQGITGHSAQNQGATGQERGNPSLQGHAQQPGHLNQQQTQQHPSQANQQERQSQRDAKSTQQNEFNRNAQQNRNAEPQERNATNQRERGPATGNAGERGSRRASIHIDAQQKSRIHDVLVRDSSIHRYRRSDIHFNVAVGTRIPETITFYDPPPQLVAIYPDFRYYKIVVLDDEILVIDPVTREIVDVIET